MRSRHQNNSKDSVLRISQRAIIVIPFLAAGLVQAQVPPAIEAGLLKIGQIKLSGLSFHLKTKQKHIDCVRIVPRKGKVRDSPRRTRSTTHMHGARMISG